MAKKRLKNRRSRAAGSSFSIAVGEARRRRFAVAAIPVGLAVLLLAYYLLRPAPTAPGDAAPGAADTPASPPAAEGRPPDPTRLVGRWQRTDGGYVLDVLAVGADGAVRAAYFNPKPINVAQARATSRGGLGLFVELRDAGYPGSTYELTYAPGPDRLTGVYYQAAIGQTFDVEFRKVQSSRERGR